MDLAAEATKFEIIVASLANRSITLKEVLNAVFHDREIRLSNGGIIKIGRGLDYFWKPEDWNAIGSQDFVLRPSLETSADVFWKQGVESYA